MREGCGVVRNPLAVYIGNVIQKAEDIELWMEKQKECAEDYQEAYTPDPRVEASLEALKASFPERIQFDDLDFRSNCVRLPEQELW